MKTAINMMMYGLVAGASMYGGYLLGSSKNKKRKPATNKTSK